MKHKLEWTEHLPVSMMPLERRNRRRHEKIEIRELEATESASSVGGRWYSRYGAVFNENYRVDRDNKKPALRVGELCYASIIIGLKNEGERKWRRHRNNHQTIVK